MPCIPIGFGVRSRKFSTIARGVMTTGTTGYGFVLGRPAIAQDGNLLSVTTGSAYTSPSSTGMATSGTGIAVINPSSPYTSSMFGSAATLAKCRCVSAGIRIKYIGTKLNEGGRIVAYSATDNSTLNGVSFDQLMSYARTTITVVKSGVWSEVIYIPQDNTSLDWVNGPDSPNGNPFMAIAVVSAVAAQPFMVEAISHWETIGVNVASVTNNPPGSEGLVSSVIGTLSNHNAGSYSLSALIGLVGAIPQIAMLAKDIRLLYTASQDGRPILPLYAPASVA